MSALLTPPPAEPISIEDLGLSRAIIEEILLKTIRQRSLHNISLLSRALGISEQITSEIADGLRHRHLLETSGTVMLAEGNVQKIQLTEAGKSRASEALKNSEYIGYLPVPLTQYRAQVRLQSAKNSAKIHSRLSKAFADLIISHDFLEHLGPAILSNRSILMYGPPGNGKSTIARCIRDALGDVIYLPHAVEYQGQIITLCDPIIHDIVPHAEEDDKSLRRSANRVDRRYFACHRPAVITGGELTLDMLDLSYSATSRSYQAPLQMKATGGVFIVDDLGRQSQPPQAIINRWIVPLEAGHDILTLHTGEKFNTPFDTLVIFSTNFHPNRIFDQAALRRIFFKIRIDGPNQEQFLRLFAKVARDRQMPLDEGTLIHLVKNKYPLIDNVYANYHAGFLVDQMLAICLYEQVPPRMSPELIDRAWCNLFVEESDVAH